MSTRLHLLAIAASLLMLEGCSVQPHQWETTTGGGHYESKRGHFTAQLPAEWIQLTNSDSSGVLVSADGPELDAISILRSDNDKAFPAIKKEASPGELPADLAANFIAEAKTAGNINLQVLTNEPAKLGGKDGFHVVLDFSTRQGVHYRMDTYGVCTDAGTYALIYRAPALHYYELYQPAFKSVVTSFQFSP